MAAGCQFATGQDGNLLGQLQEVRLAAADQRRAVLGDCADSKFANLLTDKNGLAVDHGGGPGGIENDALKPQRRWLGRNGRFVRNGGGCGFDWIRRSHGGGRRGGPRGRRWLCGRQRRGGWGGPSRARRHPTAVRACVPPLW